MASPGDNGSTVGAPFVCPPPDSGISPGPPMAYVWFATIFSAVFLVFGLMLFIYARPSSLFLRKRRLSLVVLTFVGCFLTWAGTALFDLLGPAAFPCWLLGFLFYFVPLFIVTSWLMMDAIYLAEVAAIRLGKKVALEKRKDSVNSVNVDVDDFEIVRADGSFRNFIAHIKWGMLKIRNDPEDRVRNIKFSRSKAMILFWMSFTGVPFVLAFIIRMATDPRWNQGCWGCTVARTDAVVAFCLFFCGSSVGNIFHLRKPSRNDALGITRETQLSWRCGMLPAIGMLLYIIDPNGIYQPQGLFNWLHEVLWANLLMLYIQTYHQVYKARRDAKKILMISQIDREEKYRDVIRNKDSRIALKNHLDSELSSEIYLFMDAVESYRNLTSDKEARSLKASKIMDSFIRPYGQFEINLNASLREEQEVAYTKAVTESKTSSSGLPLNLFDETYEDVKKHLLNDGFLRFLQNWSQETSLNRPKETKSGKVDTTGKVAENQLNVRVASEDGGV